MAGLFLLLMVGATALIMLHLAIGPFAHIRFLHWHQRWLALPTYITRPLIITSIVIILLGIALLLGLLPLTAD
ncbi:MAG: hypothetical protein IBX52_09355 [Bacterioplanes sp.]|nr:hypothetical protein [Bacterioplanes sp.]